MASYPLRPLVLAVMLSSCGSHEYVIGRFPEADDACLNHSAALLCSGFESSDLPGMDASVTSPSVSPWTETIVVNTASIASSTVQTHTGMRSVLAQSTGPESVAVLAREFPAVLSGSLYLRAWFYVPAELPTRTINVLFLGDYATPEPFEGVDFNLEQGGLQIYAPGNTPDRVTSAGPHIPRDTWFCLRIELAISTDQGAVIVHVNDELALEQHGMKTRSDAGVHLLRAGIDWSSLQTEPFSFYLDDLVLAQTPVACDD